MLATPIFEDNQKPIKYHSDWANFLLYFKSRICMENHRTHLNIHDQQQAETCKLGKNATHSKESQEARIASGNICHQTASSNLKVTGKGLMHPYTIIDFVSNQLTNISFEGEKRKGTKKANTQLNPPWSKHCTKIWF
ncbi:hypothetical protein VNO77_34649 [Canavalia gladiata]|uniref:Uncharacterized protein n=1 Tax=Canavalia gladiata TaxID=3824 RepID=A0AAN9PYP0_CANGL